MGKREWTPMAWRVSWFGLGDGSCLVPSVCGQVAKAITQHTWFSLGTRLRFVDMRARRVPKFDAWAITAEERCWSEEEVRDAMAAAGGNDGY